jgi:uncharacterized protein YkwD
MKLLLYICILSCFLLKAQDTITINQLNEQLLEELIKVKIDSVRKGIKINTLEIDSILYLAAKDHAMYLLKTGKLSHNQSNAKKKDPHKRIQYFGGSHYYLSGENVAFVPVLVPILLYKTNKPVTLHTYNQTADAFVQSWVKSPPHYSNIKNKAYKFTAVAVSVDVKKSTVYAVQVFGDFR